MRMRPGICLTKTNLAGGANPSHHLAVVPNEQNTKEQRSRNHDSAGNSKESKRGHHFSSN